MTWGKVAPPPALVELSKVVSDAEGPLPPVRVLPLLRDLAEQIGGRAADSFGFATVAYHALTGSEPFPDGGERPRPVTEALPGFPEPAAESLMQALSPDPSARPSPTTVVAALDEAWPAYDEPAAGAADQPAEATDAAGKHLESKADFHQAMRDLVAPARPVPELGSLDPEDGLPEPIFDPDRPSRPRRRRRSSGRRRPSAGR